MIRRLKRRYTRLTSTAGARVSANASWLAAEVRKATEKLVAQERSTIFCLSRAAEYRDPETGSHILRMAHYSRQIAGVLGLSAELQDLRLVRRATRWGRADLAPTGPPLGTGLRPWTDEVTLESWLGGWSGG